MWPGLMLQNLTTREPDSDQLAVAIAALEAVLEVESPEVVADRIRAGLRHIDPERLMVGPDCGMKYLPREAARGKLRALVDGAALVRSEL